jgi:hypothetical protein
MTGFGRLQAFQVTVAGRSTYAVSPTNMQYGAALRSDGAADGWPDGAAADGWPDGAADGWPDGAADGRMIGKPLRMTRARRYAAAYVRNR